MESSLVAVAKSSLESEQSSEGRIQGVIILNMVMPIP